MKNAMLAIGICIMAISAQTISISGKVSNSLGQPISGAIVQLLVSQIKATTDANGSYNLSGTVNAFIPCHNQSIQSHITYGNKRLIVNTPFSQRMSIKLFSLSGILVSTIYQGTVGKGITEIPCGVEGLGHGAYLLAIRTNDKNTIYKINSLSPIMQPLIGHSNTMQNSTLAKTTGAPDWIQATMQGYASHVEQLSFPTGIVNITMAAPVAPNFGANTYIFDPSMSNIQSQLTSLYSQQQGAQFGSGRCAILFKPGHYALSVLLGFYTEVLGLGLTPDSVQISGSIESDAYLSGGNATCNFWRSCAGIAVTPTGGSDLWAVSQACPMRRMHVKGNLSIAPNPGAGSGGFIADTRVEGSINGWQEQWFSRNSQYNGWSSSGWNFVFVGNSNPPSGSWPSQPITVIQKTPTIREKPFLYVDNSGSYNVLVPPFHADSSVGISWANPAIAGTSVPIDQFFITRAGTDNATSINAALASGKNLLLTPGIYNLDASIKVIRPGTIVLGIGMPSLVPQNGTPALEASDVDGLKIGGFIVDASANNSANLIVMGEQGSTKDHSSDPSSLWDIFARVGGQFSGQATCMLTINSNNVIGDHFWLWRADHGTGVGWTSNKNVNGLIVNGNNVTLYGLFVEHTQGYQTVWNGNNGRCYFYQCEFPYDVPDQASWKNGSINGFASYKVANTVTSFEGWGLGAYAFFNRAAVVLDNGFEVPANAPGIKMRNLLTVTLGGNQGTVTHIVNGNGNAVGPNTAQVARVTTYP